MTSQMESGRDRDPLECPTCKGSGEVYVQTCGHQGNCPCAEGVAVECPDCIGGVIACEWCGEEPAKVRIGHDGWVPASYVCAACDEKANNPTDREICRDYQD